MAVKQTIALIGEVSQSMEILVQLARHYRLLLVNKEEVSIDPIIGEIPGAEVEVIHCVKDGCWEADMIVLAGQEIGLELIERIREVATQKIVMVITPAEIDGLKEKNYLSLIRQGLPFSKVVEVVGLHPDKDVVVGNDKAAVSTVEKIIQLLGDIV